MIITQGYGWEGMEVGGIDEITINNDEQDIGIEIVDDVIEIEVTEWQT